MQEIHEHVELLNSQAERWHRGHHDAMHCRQTEALASVAVRLWEAIKDGFRRHPIDPASADAEARAAEATEIYQLLDRGMALIERAGADDRARGYAIDGWDAFVAARGEVADAALVPVGKALRAHRQAAAGQVRSLGDVRRELQDRLRA